MPSSLSTTVVLRRRGVRHGRFAYSAPTLPPERAQRELWERDRALHLPGILTRGLPRFRLQTRRSLALFDGLRAQKVVFQDEVRRRLRARKEFFPSGSAVDENDIREIEKVYVDGMRGKRFAARGLYAKLSWIAYDERDESLRIRFSFGSEKLLDWQKETRRAPWANRYAEALFPECAALAGNRALRAVLERRIGRRARLCERIIYNNAPGGGALFHHDCEPAQRGVIFGQLAGETAWLALPKRELARHLTLFARTPHLKRLAGTPAKALRALDGDDERLHTLLNETPAFTKHLVEHGAFFHLRAGDALLLPNHAWNDTCWHSVFALGERPSLAHSYGVFAARR